MHTIENHLLGKELIGFHFKPNGQYKQLSIGPEVNGEMEVTRTIYFNESMQIESETGIKTGWTAYPPGHPLPPPEIFLKRYSYIDGLLTKVIESNKETKKVIEEYTFEYDGDKLVSQKSFKVDNGLEMTSTRNYEYNKDGYRIKESLFLNSDERLFSQQISTFVRDEKNRIIGLTKLNGLPENKDPNKIILSNIEYGSKKVRASYDVKAFENTFVNKMEFILNEKDFILEEVRFLKDYKASTRYIYHPETYNLLEQSTTSTNGSGKILYRYE